MLNSLPGYQVSLEGLGCRWRQEVSWSFLFACNEWKLIFITVLRRPQKPQELFNLRHSSARNVIEQIFGVIKSCFQVIATGFKYNISTQVKVIMVMTFLHNFIRVTEPRNSCLSEDSLDRLNGSNSLDTQQPDTVEYGTSHTSGITRAEASRASIKREEIAQQMWNNYQKALRH